MWVFSEGGFISAVATKVDSGIVRLRARDRQSLEDISGYFQVAIEKSPDRDYPYRLEVTNEQFASWIVREIIHINYTNFKSRVHETRGREFAGALSRVWSIMHDVEDVEARVH